MRKEDGALKKRVVEVSHSVSLGGKGFGGPPSLMVLSLLKFVIGGCSSRRASRTFLYIEGGLFIRILSLFIYFRRETKGYEDPKETDLGRTAGR